METIAGINAALETTAMPVPARRRNFLLLAEEGALESVELIRGDLIVFGDKFSIIIFPARRMERLNEASTKTYL